MKHKLNKLIKICIITLIISFSLYISIIPTSLSKLESNLKDIFSIIQRVYAKRQSENYYQLEQELNESLKQEVTNLKKLLNLNNTMSNFTTIPATTISRQTSFWFQTLTLDKGSSSGIKKDMAVITPQGLIGKISNVTKNTSEVKLITTNDITFKTSVVIRIDTQEHYAILNGYDPKTNLLKVSAIDKKTPIEEGNQVSTSGLGAMPKGLLIGTVVKTELDSYNLSKVVYVKPSQDLSNINYVLVLGEERYEEN